MTYKGKICLINEDLHALEIISVTGTKWLLQYFFFEATLNLLEAILLVVIIIAKDG